MEKYSITALAVVDSADRPIGVIHIHDILKAGVA
jgi:arabinose-5-phosphate isomerase